MSIEQILNDYTKAKTALEQELKQRGKEAFADLVKSIFNKHAGLQAFAIKGYTPNFNDGDPCTHSSAVFVGLVTGPHKRTWSNPPTEYYYTDVQSDGAPEEVFELLFPYDELSDGDFVDDSVKYVSINEGCVTLEEATEEIYDLEEIAQKIWKTNYLITAKLEDDGTVTVTHDDYDCGY